MHVLKLTFSARPIMKRDSRVSDLVTILKQGCVVVKFCISRWFADFSEHDHARAGNVASSTVELDEGPLTQFSHAIEPHLRKLGLPVSLKKGLLALLLVKNSINSSDSTLLIFIR